MNIYLVPRKVQMGEKEDNLIFVKQVPSLEKRYNYTLSLKAATLGIMERKKGRYL